MTPWRWVGLACFGAVLFYLLRPLLSWRLLILKKPKASLADRLNMAESGDRLLWISIVYSGGVAFVLWLWPNQAGVIIQGATALAGVFLVAGAVAQFNQRHSTHLYERVRDAAAMLGEDGFAPRTIAAHRLKLLAKESEDLRLHILGLVKDLLQAACTDLKGKNLSHPPEMRILFCLLAEISRPGDVVHMRGLHYPNLNLADVMSELQSKSAELYFQGRWDFGNAMLDGAIICGARFGSVSFADADLEGANLIGLQAEKSDFSNCRAENIKLGKAKLGLRPDFRGAKMKYGRFEDADLAEAMFDGAVVDDAEGLPHSVIAQAQPTPVPLAARQPSKPTEEPSAETTESLLGN